MAILGIASFIERMEEIGDVWEEADVEHEYRDPSLEEALKDASAFATPE